MALFGLLILLLAGSSLLGSEPNADAVCPVVEDLQDRRQRVRLFHEKGHCILEKSLVKPVEQNIIYVMNR